MDRPTCVFCRIVTGDLESSKVYEDDRILAFMDIQPVRPGQVLVIPKEHIDHFSDIPGDLAQWLFAKVHQISGAIKSRLKPQRVGLVVNGYGVAHAHMIIVPQEHEHDITSGRMAKIENGEIVFSVKNLAFASRQELNLLADLIR